MVSTRQSSNSSTHVDGSTFVELGPGPSGSSRRSHHQAGLSASVTVSTGESNLYINLLDLPVEILQKILGYMDYNTIANLRPVCHQMDKVCGSILSSTFQRLQTQMLSRFQAIKAQMPRRESARRNHPLACESDIIETLHMRLTLLQMSFGKHIERKHCCFFPGGILDEVYRILHYIKVTPKLGRPYKVTDELFDLSTMAMEFFKDSIEPTLPEIPYFGAEFLDLAGTMLSSPLSVSEGKARGGSRGGGSGSGGEGSPSRSGNDEPGGSCSGLALESNVATPPQSNMVLRKRIRKIKQGMKRYNSQLSLMRRELRNTKAKIAEQQKQMLEYATRLDDNDKKNDETSRKFSTLLQVFTKELNKCKTELQYWRSKSPAIPVCFGCGQSIPVPAEDLQALANQGVLSNVEASVNEGLDFIPIADMVVHSPTEREVDAMLGTQSPPPAQQPHKHPAQSSISCTSSSCSPPVEPMAPPLSAAPITLPLISSKRKSSSSCLEEDSVKKPRRALKSRQAKRSKI
ncbi:F-box only protein 28 isoform X3 [Nasonia vitripennis]|uniref:F-box domain-containing protein n=1 Tax=Nasonia vitripennis TaxID=7425 RepID=A0A7M7QVQ0_NASVI|nr:F-box only protein 28 isoform X3 [Nasonia vitripennis]XP_032455289.1 F-box only protein 28 isoform X3 [Nasonia vitripennis]XP_032455290.1 F-box only protein 28 isoform X3 [Nasonia vitripennis]